MRIVFVTCPSQIAQRLLMHLVEKRFVAGGNIIPNVQSIYRWNNQIVNSEESIVFMETSANKVNLMIDELVKIHPYQVPKIVTFTPEKCLESYKKWVLAESDCEPLT